MNPMNELNALRAEVAAISPHAHILAVSKTQSPQAVIALARLGQRDFGENYVQELTAKAKAVRELAPELEIRWHLIGHLQRNKIVQVLPVVHSIHSLDSVRLAQAIASKIDSSQSRLPVFLQVNLDAQMSKSGFGAEELFEAVPALLTLQDRLDFRGLMTIPQPTSAGGNPAQAFRATRGLEARLRDLGLTQGELSMGMSGDYLDALRAGATWIRIGTALFGDRPMR